MRRCLPATAILLLAWLWQTQPVFADPDGFDSRQLFGTWQAWETIPGQGNVETVFIIRDDRTFSGTMAINNEVVWRYGGSWTLTGNRLTWHYTQSSLTMLEADKTETDEILTLSGDTLTYRSGSRGSISTLQRMQQPRP